MNIDRLLKLLRNNLLLIVIVTLLCTAGGLAYGLMAPKKYEASSQLYVSVSGPSGGTSDLVQGAAYSTQIVNSYVDIIGTSLVLDPVIKKLNLGESSKDLAKRVKAASPEGSVLINLTVSDRDSGRAAEIANGVAESLRRVVANHLENSGNQRRGQEVKLTTTQKAEGTEKTVGPNLVLDVLLGLVAGLILSCGFVVARDALDNRVRSLADVEELTDIPLLGGVLDDPTVEQNPLTVQIRPASPRAESFRSLRTNLQFITIPGENNIYVMTSPNQGEGKSTTAANLALVLAGADSRVCLIEADLRLPKVHEYLNVEATSGLSDYLVGRVELQDILEPWGRTTLDFLPAGKIPPNPSELLSSARMQELLIYLGNQYDYVIVDAPPILSVTDAAALGRDCVGALVAVAAGSTTKNDVKSALRALDLAGVEVKGLIVTKMLQKSAQQYGYGNYGYGAGPVGRAIEA